VKKRFLRRLGGKRRGFTLIELLIVLSILAVLAAVVVLALTGFIGRGETAACEADEDAIQTAAVAYYYENDGDWPTAGGGDAADIDFGLLAPTYLTEAPGTDAECIWGLDTGGVVCTQEVAVGDCGCSTPCGF
jgi:prepilin-type N-terminal cleavage/methylation domain-containing protein